MKLFYVSGPYSAPSEYLVKQNIAKAEAAAVAIWQAGGVAICPHLNTAHWGDLLTHDRFIKGDLEIVRRCDAMLMVDGWKQSKGATEEWRYAISCGLFVAHSMVDAVRFIENSEFMRQLGHSSGELL